MMCHSISHVSAENKCVFWHCLAEYITKDGDSQFKENPNLQLQIRFSPKAL